MGYFDTITEIAFKKGDNGETIYFPNGIFSKGRLVENPERKEKLFKYHKRLNKYFLPFSVLYGVLIGLSGETSLTGFMPIIIIAILIFIRQRILIKGLPVHNQKLTLKETSSSASKAFHPAILILMIVNGLAAILLSLSIPFILDKPLNEILSLVLIPLVVGIASLGIGLYLYKIRKNNIK